MAGIHPAPLAPGAIRVSGVLPGDTTWSGDVRVTGDVTVPAGATLTVAPGTVVRFAALSDDTAGGQDPSRCELIVHGTLSAKGTSSVPIVLTSTAPAPSPDDWYGIIGVAANVPVTIVCRYTTIEYTRTAITIDAEFNANCHLDNCILRKCSWGGIRAALTGHGIELALTVERSQLLGGETTQYDSDGIHLEPSYDSEVRVVISGSTIDSFHNAGIFSGSGTYASWVISDSQISNNYTGCELFIYDQSSLTLARNIVIQNRSWGMHIQGSAESITIQDNVVSYSDHGLYLESNAIQTIKDNYFHHNELGMEIYGGDAEQTERLITRNSFEDNSRGMTLNCPLMATFNRFLANGAAIGILSRSSAAFHFNEFTSAPGSAAIVNEVSGYVDARWNYWGAEATAEMARNPYPSGISTIIDYFDDPEKGFVDYADWLDQPASPPASPWSKILFPDREGPISAARMVITGLADAPSGIRNVEVSTDDGVNWQGAEGTSSWRLDWMIPTEGVYTIRSRAVDSNGHRETPGDSITVTIAKGQQIRMGLLEEDETWDGEVILLGDVTVPAGMTLTIQPGTVVRSAAWQDGEVSGLDPNRTELMVLGNLQANGTAELPITFTGEYPTEMAQWGGIRILSDLETLSPADISICHSLIEQASQGILVDTLTSTQLFLTDSEIRSCAASGISIRVGGDSVLSLGIQHCNFLHLGADSGYSGSQRGGLILQSEGSEFQFHFFISECTFQDLEGTGISVDAFSGGRCIGTVEANVVSTIRGDGLYFIFNNPLSRLNVFRNQVDDTQYDSCISVHGLCDAEISGNRFTHGDPAARLHCDGNMKVTNNVFSDSGYPGVDFEILSGAGLFAWNQVLDNSIGAYFDFNRNTTAILKCNRIEGNDGEIEIRSFGGRELFFLNNLDDPKPPFWTTLRLLADECSAQWNYWGPTSTAEIQAIGETGNLSFIEDGHDYPDIGFADISHWQAEPIPLLDAPLTRVTAPVADSAIEGAQVRLDGYALAPEGVERVEISADGGQTWAETAYAEPDLKELWTWLWFAPGDGTYTFRTRLVTAGETVEKPGGSVTVTVTDAAPIDGDLNRDGLVNATDFDLMRSVLSESAPSEPFDPAMLDVNGDGLIDVLDLMWLALLIAG